MATTYTVSNKGAIPFTTTIDMTATTSTDKGATVDTIACYYTTWVEIHVSCATKDVTLTVTPDTTGGNLPTYTLAMTAGKSYTMWVLVNGTYPGVAVAYGSHTFAVTATSTVGGAHGDVTGYYVLHGLRQS